MNDIASNPSFGIPSRAEAPAPAEKEPARYLVVIDSAAAGTRIARLHLASHVAVAEFDAAAPEVVLMTDGLVAVHNANDTAWDEALAGHSRDERRHAEVYTLDA